METDRTPMDDDPALVRRALAGEDSAYRVLVDRHAPALLAWLRWFARDRSAREDASQEAFLAAWRSLGTFDASRGSFRAWIFRIGRNLALNAERRRRPRPVADPGAEARGRDPEEPAEFARLDRALARLPAQQRAIVVLAEIHGLPLAEVAVLEGVPLGTVKSRLSRARQRLRVVLARRGEEVRR